MIIAIIVIVILVLAGLKIYLKLRRRDDELAELRRLILKPEENVTLLEGPSDKLPKEEEEPEVREESEIPAHITGGRKEVREEADTGGNPPPEDPTPEKKEDKEN